MKFKFPLQKVLEHRKIKEDLVQKDFQDALNDLRALEQKLADMEQAMHEAHLSAFDKQQSGGNAGAALSQINEFTKNQKILIQMQMVKVAQQEKVVEQRRDLLRQAAVDTKVISTFKEKKFEEFKKNAEMEEQKEMDEQSILRFKTAEKKEAS